MIILPFGGNLGRYIRQYGSQAASLSGIARIDGTASVRCMAIGPDGNVGFHRAAAPQLFLVVQGEGWVRGESEERIPVRAGQAVFWQKDEWHASGSRSGMTAIVIEADSIRPADVPADGRVTEET